MVYIQVCVTSIPPKRVYTRFLIKVVLHIVLSLQHSFRWNIFKRCMDTNFFQSIEIYPTSRKWNKIFSAFLFFEYNFVVWCGTWEKFKKTKFSESNAALRYSVVETISGIRKNCEFECKREKREREKKEKNVLENSRLYSFVLLLVIREITNVSYSIKIYTIIGKSIQWKWRI